MERIFLPIVIGGGVIVLVGFLIWLFLHLEKKRTAALQAIAEELGLHFSATQSEDLSARMQKFPLFNKGRGRKIRNVMSTETDLARLTIFDYQYTTGGWRTFSNTPTNSCGYGVRGLGVTEFFSETRKYLS